MVNLAASSEPHACARWDCFFCEQPLFTRKTSKFSAREIAYTVAAAFAVAGFLWVLVSDLTLYAFASDPVLIARIETAKGWAFVAVGALFVYYITVRSASALARDRATIKAVIESIADGVLLLGRDRRIERANPAAARMLRCDNLAGMGVEEFSRRFRVSYPNGAVLPMDEFISQRVFDEAGPLTHRIVLYPEPNGSELVISAKAAAVRTSLDERPELVVSVMHDITDAAQFDRLRDDFFAAAAHSLKTPVAVIKTNAEIVSIGDTAMASESAAAIKRQCERIDLLLENLLVLARVGSNTLQLYPRDVDLRTLVERVVQQGVAARGPRDVKCDLAGSPRVHADSERLALALRNLVDSAYRLSTPRSPIQVLMTQQGCDVEVGVRHTSIAAGQPDAVLSMAYDGLGVSRLVATTIIESHGGTLRDEAAGAETTVWVRLPVLE
jgi:two-component system, OmpR family, phosphate regulon sensor histidine kinase PhoR